MIIDGFYIKTNAPKFKQTAIPTGMLRSPLDLVTKPQPWLTVSNNPEDNVLEKKTLIFADHLYQYRPYETRKAIIKALTEALQAGFTILILTPTGSLQNWEGRNLANSYHLSFDKYSDEVIQSLAWKQHSLVDKQIFIFNYFGINELLGIERYLINTSFLRYNASALAQLVSSSPSQNFEIYFDKDDDVSILFSLSTDEFQKFADRITAVDLSNVKLDNLNLNLFFDNFSNLREFNYFGERNPYSRLVMNLPDRFLNKLGKFKSGNININTKEFFTFVSKASNLRQISLNCQFNYLVHFVHLTANDLSRLRIRSVELLNGNITPKSVYRFLVSPYLEELFISASMLPPNGSNVPRVSLIGLKKLLFHLDSVIRVDDLVTELFSAPNLQHVEIIANTFLLLSNLNLLPANVFKNIKKLTLTNVSLPIGGLLKACINLEELCLENCSLDVALADFSAGSLKNLRIFSLNNRSEITEKFFELLNSATKLEKLSIDCSLCEETILKQLQSFSLRSLKKLTITSNSEFIFQAFLRAAPNLEEVFYRVSILGNTLAIIALASEKILDAASNLQNLTVCTTPGNRTLTLYKRKELYLSNLNGTTTELYNLLSSLPGLEVLSFSGTSISDSEFRPQKTKLKVITIINTDLPFAVFESLVEHSPALEEINLDTHLLISENLKPNSLKSIKSLELSNVYSQLLTGELLSIIFKAAPALEEIIIATSILIASSDKLSAGIAMCLKKIDLVEPFGKPKDIAALQAAAPNALIVGEDIKTKLPPRLEHNFNKNKKLVDQDYLDTSKKQKSKQKFIEYFPEVNPGIYRLRISQPNLNSLELFSDFPPDDFHSIKLSKKNFFNDPKIVCKKGVITISATDGNKFLLPSLDAEEKVFDLKVVDENGKIISANDYDVKRSASSQFHQVVFRNRGNYTIHFYVAIADKPKLSPRLTKVVKKYLAFAQHKVTESALNFITLSEAAFFITGTKAGSCRHRAIAAYAELVSEYQDNIRITSNDLHMFIEIKDFGTWFEINLGGRDSDLVETKMPVHDLPNNEKTRENKESLQRLLPMEVLNNELKPDPVNTRNERGMNSVDVSTPEAPSVSSYFEVAMSYVSMGLFQAVSMIRIVDGKSASIEEIQEDEYQLQEGQEDKEQLDSPLSPDKSDGEAELDKTTSTILVITNSDASLKKHYATMREQLGAENIFIARQPEDISVIGYGMTAEGQVRAAYTPLHNWLHARTSGVVVIDIRHFDDSEVAQLNDFIDHQIEDQVIPENIVINLVDAPGRAYGPDFKRRVNPDQIFLSDSNEALLPAATDNTALTIDLFNSYYWQAILLGTWQLVKKPNEKDLSFHWHSGSLLKLILENTSQAIIFKNPPRHDPTFSASVAELQGLRRVTWADQSHPIPSNMTFSQQSGYEWNRLSANASLQTLTDEQLSNVYVLSDSNVLSFIQDQCYEFSPASNKLEAQESYLNRSQASGTINIVCAPDLSEGALAQVLTAANNKNIQVTFLTPADNSIPGDSALQHLKLKSLTPGEEFHTLHVTWQLHTDIYFATRKLLTEEKNISYFDLSSLEPPELTRYPESLEKLHETFLKDSKFAMQAYLPDILQKLLNGETVLLSGKIPPSIYFVLSSLSLGLVEGKVFNGKLIILTSPTAEQMVKILTAENLIVQHDTFPEKVALLKKILPRGLHPETVDAFIAENPSLESADFATMENAFLQAQILQTPMLTAAELLPLSDEERAKEIDAQRLQNVQAILDISPWAMIEGVTGIGKTDFLHKVIPKKNKFFKLEEWLHAKPAAGEKALFIIDEANFLSELGGLGKNFLERFKGLKGNPPSFFWRGKYFELTSQHKVIFAFNPASYGAGRSAEGILEEHKLAVKLQRLPDFYWRERIIKPLVTNVLQDSMLAEWISALLPNLSSPIMFVYNWILQNSNASHPLMTPREIKVMVNLVVSKILTNNLKDPVIIERLAAEIAYRIGAQAISEHPELKTEFDKNFYPTHSISETLTRTLLPSHYAAHQEPAYRLIEDLLEARKNILSQHNVDLGLGGIVLEGGSGIGKSTFINHIKADYKKQFPDKKVYRISPTTSYSKKVSILTKAFAEGALVLADEINTSLWPNKLLNNFLMGLDAEGKGAKQPGFFLIATQNPPSVEGREEFKGRFEEDPALRRRVIKLKLNWPRYTSDQKLSDQTPAQNVLATRATVFAAPRNPLVIHHEVVVKKPKQRR